MDLRHLPDRQPLEKGRSHFVPGWLGVSAPAAAARLLGTLHHALAKVGGCLDVRRCIVPPSSCAGARRRGHPLDTRV